MISVPSSHVYVLDRLVRPVRDEVVDHVAVISHIDIEKEPGIDAQTLFLHRKDRSSPLVSRRTLGGFDDALVHARPVNHKGIAADDLQGVGQIPIA